MSLRVTVQFIIETRSLAVFHIQLASIADENCAVAEEVGGQSARLTGRSTGDAVKVEITKLVA